MVNVLFDLDGTLIDSTPGIMMSASIALEGLGMRTDIDPTAFIGPPLRQSFTNLGLSNLQAEQAVTLFRDYYGKKGLFECSLYEGVQQMLLNFGDMGAKLFLATCKPAVYAERILDHFNLLSLFEFISGAELDGGRSSKKEVIAQALEKTEQGDISIMVGDAVSDILAAHEAGLTAFGVTYGMGKRLELENQDADFIVDSVYELEKSILLYLKNIRAQGTFSGGFIIQ